MAKAEVFLQWVFECVCYISFVLELPLLKFALTKILTFKLIQEKTKVNKKEREVRNSNSSM